MDHPPDPIIVKGISPIYPAYRGTVLGQALESVLSDLKEAKVIDDEIEARFNYEFDKTITRHMDELSPSSCKIEGTTENFKFIYNYYNICLIPGIIKFDDGRTITSESIEIMALSNKEGK
jgi:hypothetical protein